MRFTRFRASMLRSVSVTVLGLSLLGAAIPASAASDPPASSIPQGYGRIWIYRLYEPSVSRNDSDVDLNGTRVDSVLPWGSVFYRDVQPGKHRITVENSAAANDSKELVVVPGQEVFAKIVVTDSYLSGGGLAGVHREIFAVWPVTPARARAEIATQSVTEQP